MNKVKRRSIKGKERGKEGPLKERDGEMKVHLGKGKGK